MIKHIRIKIGTKPLKESSINEEECLSDHTTDSEEEIAKYGRKIRTEAMHTIREEQSYISGARININREEVVVQRAPESRYTSGLSQQSILKRPQGYDRYVLIDYRTII